MLQFKALQDFDSRPEFHTADSLVEDLIYRLIINFQVNLPYFRHQVLSGKPFHRPLSIWGRGP